MRIFEDAFRFVDTHGIPLGLIVERAAEQGISINLHRFIADAIRAGWSKQKAIAAANEAVNDLRAQHCWFAIRELA